MKIYSILLAIVFTLGLITNAKAEITSEAQKLEQLNLQFLQLLSNERIKTAFVNSHAKWTEMVDATCSLKASLEAGYPAPYEALKQECVLQKTLLRIAEVQELIELI